jgi:uroporphyrinogen-III synthase
VGEGTAEWLKGKRVVVTRAAEQCGDLIAALRARGAVPVMLPMVGFAPPDDEKLLDEALRGLRAGSYDWVFVTSQNAVRALRERCESLKMDLRETFGGVKIAAVGPTSAEAIANAGLQVAYVASKHTGLGLAEELDSEVRGKWVLLPRSDRANADLVRHLRQSGARVAEVCAYKTIVPEGDDLRAAEEPMKEGTDAVLFFSPSAVRHFRDFVGSEEFVELSGRAAFAAIGPVTEGALRESKVGRVLVARDTTVASIVRALEDHFEQESVGGAERSAAQSGMAVPHGERAMPRGVKRG